MGRRKKLTISEICDKICELEGYIDYLSESMHKRFANKMEIQKNKDNAQKELSKYRRMLDA